MKHVLVLAAVLGACGGGDARPVAVVLAAGTDGTLHLFTIAPGGAPRELDLDETRPVSDAVVSPGGRAIAFIAGDADDAELRRYRPDVGRASTRVDGLGRLVGVHLEGISDDGATILVSRGDTLVVVRDGVREIETRSLGTRMYGTALSPDGARLAFSTMQPSCSRDAAAMATCPVTLWIADTAGGEPRRLTTARVAYDPELRGDRVLYLTDADDASAGCARHVSACRYTIHEIGVDGTGDRAVADDAVLGRRAPDGTLAFHRNGPARDDGIRSWTVQTLLVAPPGADPIEVGPVDLAADRWSPDGRWLLAQIGGAAQILDRRGALVGAPSSGKGLRLLGWLARPAPTGTLGLSPGATLAAAHGPLEEALIAASRRAGDLSAVAYASPTEEPLTLEPAPPHLATLDELDAWLAGTPPRYAVVASTMHCRAASSRGTVVDHTLAWVTLAGSVPAPRPPEREPRAVFTWAQGDGRVELVDVELPASVSAGERFPVTLWWRVLGGPGYGWRVFVHFDAAATRFAGDHDVLCADANRLVGTLAADTFTVEAGHVPGTYRVYTGWFSNSAGRVPADPDPHGDDRVEIGTIEVK